MLVVSFFVLKYANEPSLTRFLSHVNKVDKWKLMHRMSPI